MGTKPKTPMHRSSGSFLSAPAIPNAFVIRQLSSPEQSSDPRMLGWQVAGRQMPFNWNAEPSTPHGHVLNFRTSAGKTTELQPLAFHSSQGSLINNTLQLSRWLPTPSLGNKAARCIDDGRYDGGLFPQFRPPLLRTRPLMAIKCAGVKVAIVVEGQNIERDPDNLNCLAVYQFNADIGHAHTHSGETRQAVTGRIPQQLVELGIRQAKQNVVLIEQKYAK